MILGFAGKAASGKTTAARHLAPLLDRETLIVPMALVLRDEVEEFLRACGAVDYIPLVYGDQEDKLRVFSLDEDKAIRQCPQWPEFIAENGDIQESPGRTALTVRRVLQWWGTEYRRAQDPDYWTKAWERKIRDYDLSRTQILIDDVRFINELVTIKGLGGLIVKIERPGFAAAGNHASETSLDHYRGWDRVIVNDGSLKELLAKAEQLVELQA